jgi:phytoene synthase
MTNGDLGLVGAGTERLDAERRLALLHAAVAARSALEALWTLDAAIGAVVAAGGQPMIRQLKLAWWRDALRRLDAAAAPAEPVLRALADHLLRKGIGGEALSELTVGWEHLVGNEPLTADELDSFARLRGGLLFRYSAILLGCGSTARIEEAGEAWALIDLARHSRRDEEIADILAAARIRLPRMGHWPRALRPLGMLALLAERDARHGNPFERQGSPRRMLRMLRHRLTGR